MDLKQFKENLLLYGADVHRWPEEIRNAGLEALKNSSEFRFLADEEAKFERVLKSRKYEEPDSYLERRIISAALRIKKNPPSSLGIFLLELLAEFRLPRPALIALSILIIGFTIGFLDPIASAPTEQDPTTLQAFLYYEEEIP
ncbi:MAG TPA: hypothetical protein VNM22_09915 [Candidatus Limnocylindrales bacterium]|nr:hypothetical protein [Candidatus Limnocylindrales bacterium]